MLKLNDVAKSYGKKMVLYNVNLDFNNRHGVYGLLGRNGVGKTTMMQMIFNMIDKYDGVIEYEGQNVRNNSEALENIVYVGGTVYQNNTLYQGKLKHLLKTYDAMYDSFDLAFAKQLLEEFEIDESSKFHKLSTGNKTIVQNILGLASRVKITILDEPTNGLDSVNRQIFFRHMMEDYEAHPRMFILSTHLIQEIENYLTDVVMLKKSKVLLADPIEDIQAKSHRVKNYHFEDKNVIHEETLGGYTIQDIYDELTEEDMQAVTDAGGSIGFLDLQSLFNNLMEG